MRRNSGVSKVMIIVIALTMVVLLGGMAVVMMKVNGSHKGKKEVKKLPTTQVALGEFVVNLADTNEIRYLKTDVVLVIEGKMAEDSKGEGEGEDTGVKPRIRDAVIEVMSSKQFLELVKPEGKAKMKKDIIEAVNKRLKEDGVKAVDIYFNEFAMQ